MKNILLVVPRLNIGGAETYVATTARGLKERGYNVYTASGGGSIAAEMAEEGIKHFFVPIRLNASLAAWLLARIVRRYCIDIIHANSAAAGIAAVKLKDQFPDLKIIYTAHGVFGHNQAEMTIDKADKIICVSKFVEQYAIEKKYTPAKLTTIYTGIDTEKFRPHRQDKRKLREQYGLSADKFTLAIVARVKSLLHKGHEDLLEIMQKPNAASWQLAVIGKGSAAGKLKRLADQYGLNENIHFLGHINNVEQILDAADVVVLPSKIETFGLVLAEAMAMEKPVVAYAVGGTPEVIGTDGTAGLLAELNNRQDLYEKIASLAADPVLAARIGHAGRLRVERKFSCAAMLDRLEQVYNEK